MNDRPKQLCDARQQKIFCVAFDQNDAPRKKQIGLGCIEETPKESVVARSQLGVRRWRRRVGATFGDVGDFLNVSFRREIGAMSRNNDLDRGFPLSSSPLEIPSAAIAIGDGGALLVLQSAAAVSPVSADSLKSSVSAAMKRRLLKSQAMPRSIKHRGVRREPEFELSPKCPSSLRFGQL